MPISRPDRSFTRAGTWIILGLLMQGLTLFQAHPLAFIAFAVIGIVPVAVGLLLFLRTVGRRDPTATEATSSS